MANKLIRVLGLVGLILSPNMCNGAEIFEGMITQFLSGSPTSMMYSWLSMMDPPEFITNTLLLIGSAAQTKDEELDSMAENIYPQIGYDCNLTNIDADCFLQYLAAAVGESWNSAEEDVKRASEMIDKHLKPKKKTMSAALAVCVLVSKAIPLLSNPEKKITNAAPIVNDAKEHCKL